MIEAPRWRLTAPHYLRVNALPDGTIVEWEYKEINTMNGRMARKLHTVPLLLNPDDPSDHNYPGEIIVTNFVEGAAIMVKDIIFEGSPTPDMEPLNETAVAISNSMRSRWDHPIESLPTNGGMTPEESVFMQNLVRTFSKTATMSAEPSVPKADYDELKTRLEALEATITKTATSERRI